MEVTENTGIKIPAYSPHQVVNDLTEAMERLAADPDLRRRMGEDGRQRVLECYTWDQLGEWTRSLYEEIT